MSPCRLTESVIWGSQRLYIDLQKVFVPNCFLLCSRTITVLLNTLCMLGWENGIIYVNIGYIFLTVPLGPTWVYIAMGRDPRGVHPVCNILTAALQSASCRTSE